ncbi:hypothetical protein LCGC14_1516980 [marine sediment metagenome]|uniref:Uncharacterized protein n=1 Tax=marine sediment metagenome TaxID=412755 RepID=A0A0F9IZT2_9ZZZZ
MKILVEYDLDVEGECNPEEEMMEHLGHVGTPGNDKFTILANTIEIKQGYEQLKAERDYQGKVGAQQCEAQRVEIEQFQADLKEAIEIQGVNYQEGRKLREEEFQQLQVEIKKLKLKHTIETCQACSKFVEVPQIVLQLKQLQAENRWLKRRVRALEDLGACYRCGTRPTEKLFKELERTKQALKRKAKGE